MKKLLIVAVLFFMLMSAAFADDLRLGLEFGNRGGEVIVRPIPFDIKLGYNLYADPGSFSISLDYRFIDGLNIVDPLRFALAGGAYVGAAGTDIYAGVQLPVYLQLYIANTLEVFFEVAPQFALVPTPAFANFKWGLGLTVPSPF